jgi:NAD(P)H-hydrate epimerase
VLTGILTGLLAQGYESLQAAHLGVFLHGLAGDLAVPEYGMNSLIASDLVNFLPSAFLRLHRD